MEEEFEVKSGELAGFCLAGWVQPSGVIKLNGGEGRYIEKWPEEIYILGNTFTLEEITTSNINSETGERYECAEYV